MVYVDESGFSNDVYREHGWAKKGQKIYGDRSGKSWTRTSLLLAQNKLKRFAPLLFTGTCNAELFNAWLEKSLIPELKKGQTVIMDNAQIHKNKRTQVLIEEAGCRLLYLPPYSPDFNPIEKTFGALKKKWKFMPNNTSLDELVCSIV